MCTAVSGRNVNNVYCSFWEECKEITAERFILLFYLFYSLDLMYHYQYYRNFMELRSILKYFCMPENNWLFPTFIQKFSVNLLVLIIFSYAVYCKQVVLKKTPIEYNIQVVKYRVLLILAFMSLLWYG